MSYIKKFLYEVNEVYDTELTKQRIGKKSDGGYVTYPEIFKKANTVYSLGVGDDVSFEKELIAKYSNIEEIFLFDPTIEKLPEENVKFSFRQEEGLNVLNEEIKQDSVLKMDIEWDEWEMFLEANKDFLNKFSQMFLEIHLVTIEDKKGLSPYFTNFYKNVYGKINEVMFETHYKVLKKLNDLFYIYHIHANNSLPKVELNGYSFPPLIELSLVRKDLVKNTNMTNEIFPVKGLDFQNKTDRDDIEDFYPIGG